jgi:hypothetical protein
MFGKVIFLGVLLLGIYVGLPQSADLSDKPVPAQPSPIAGYHVYAHAHNDYEHMRPLLMHSITVF